MNLKGRGAAFLGFAALVGLFAFNHWLFSKWMGTAYWRWYLTNGTLIGLITPIKSPVSMTNVLSALLFWILRAFIN